MRQVLFVVEGEKAEHNAVLACRQVFGIESADFAILTFGTHIHSLIRTIGGGQHGADIDFEGVELREVLADLIESGEGTLKGLEHYGIQKHGRSDADWLRTAEITDFYLLFDFDPHASEYSGDDLKGFQRAFINSAGDLGKLLLSYPMFESYKVAAALSFEEYIDLCACEPFATYKQVVNGQLREAGKAYYADLRKYQSEDFAQVIAFAATKANSLIGGVSSKPNDALLAITDLANSCDEVDLYALLMAQQRRYEEDGDVPVVCTGFFFLSAWPQLVNDAWKRRRPSFENDDTQEIR